MDQRHPASPDRGLRGPTPRGLLESVVGRTVFWLKRASLRRIYHKRLRPITRHLSRCPLAIGKGCGAAADLP
jgi:hypothetical protein